MMLTTNETRDSIRYHLMGKTVIFDTSALLKAADMGGAFLQELWSIRDDTVLLVSWTDVENIAILSRPSKPMDTRIKAQTLLRHMNAGLFRPVEMGMAACVANSIRRGQPFTAVTRSVSMAGALKALPGMPMRNVLYIDNRFRLGFSQVEPDLQHNLLYRVG